MKISNYNLKVNFDNHIIIFNKLSKKYVIYSSDKEELVTNIITNISSSNFEIENANILLKLGKAGIIIGDKEDETNKLSYLINKTKYQDRKLLLVISPTMDCNFRCPYCIEEHKNTYMSEETEDNIIKFVEKMSKLIGCVQVSWFGGEPTIALKTINKINRKLKEICNANGCEYTITITTNGFLLSDNVLDELNKYNIKRLQITVDGDEEHHDKKRILANGSGTYKTILSNIINALDKNINIVLRINIDEDNKDSVYALLDAIPYEKRKKVMVHISNLFQTVEPIKLFEMYKMAIDKGYIFKYFHKQLQFCEAGFINSFTIQPNGEIGPCQIGYDSNIKFGEITKNGNINVTNKSDYYNFRQSSPLDDDECLECDDLPLCLGGCPVSRFKGNKKCAKKDKLGITISELLKLEIYSNMKNNLIDKECIL
ncbi:radical SAM protein [Sedimentibacter sp. zth1]|uniref:radical SAM/SPASM domain-containing protein n=1 Tax=Sedimentibacter sp. zth1 TaxID=2816908 RepID=UPI001A923D87|nr:radical SAM protein [Sedimentibacter sp. zth1]QSX05340.1 radical SAM protein [Sedimentibacter sp. zth1]